MVAGFMFVLTALLWLILLGWIIHLWSIIDAALYKKPDPYENRFDRYDRQNRYSRYDRYYHRRSY